MLDVLLPAIRDGSMPPRDRLGLQNDLFALVSMDTCNRIFLFKIVMFCVGKVVKFHLRWMISIHLFCSGQSRCRLHSWRPKSCRSFCQWIQLHGVEWFIGQSLSYFSHTAIHRFLRQLQSIHSKTVFHSYSKTGMGTQAWWRLASSGESIIT